MASPRTSPEERISIHDSRRSPRSRRTASSSSTVMTPSRRRIGNPNALSGAETRWGVASGRARCRRVGDGGGGREPGRRWKAGEAEVEEAPWESGPEGCSDGRLEAAGCQGPGARGGDGVVAQASESSGAD